MVGTKYLLALVPLLGAAYAAPADGHVHIQARGDDTPLGQQAGDLNYAFDVTGNALCGPGGYMDKDGFHEGACPYDKAADARDVAEEREVPPELAERDGNFGKRGLLLVGGLIASKLRFLNILRGSFTYGGCLIGRDNDWYWDHIGYHHGPCPIWPGHGGGGGGNCYDGCCKKWCRPRGRH